MAIIGYAAALEQFHPNDLLRYSSLAEKHGFKAVMAADPEVVLRASTVSGEGDAFALWRGLAAFRPTAHDNLLRLPTDSLVRHSPRILDGAEMMCAALDGVRAKRT